MAMPARVRLPALPVCVFASMAALACAAPPAHARIGEAEVREGPRGGPCFTITPKEERQGIPDFHAISVSDGQRLLWKMTMPRERSFPLGFGTCVPYGGRTAALPHAEAASLEPGRVYYLHIEARPGGKGRAASSYEARFCLARQRDGSVVVHQIWHGDRQGPRMFGCLPPGD